MTNNPFKLNGLGRNMFNGSLGLPNLNKNLNQSLNLNMNTHFKKMKFGTKRFSPLQMKLFSMGMSRFPRIGAQHGRYS